MRTTTDISPQRIRARRWLFLWGSLLVFSPAFLLMVRILSVGGFTVLETLALVLFSVLFVLVVYGGVIALTGYWLLRNGGDPLRVSKTIEGVPVPESFSKTAIAIPIYNEDVGQVFQRLKVVYQSLQNTGRLADFDFFVLSDSNDPNYWIAEEKMWLQLCKQVDGFGRIFYRKRRVTLNHKSGNVADFCRRWGADYKYMIVLDADSVMTGETLVKLVHLMERNPIVGIIQTAPQQIMGRSLFSRIQQFAARTYASIFAAGVNFWQLGEGTFWGHNAIVRLQPFMQFCALPELPKVGGLRGRILSHDSVEAAFMCRAGYHVWFAYDLDGSYEEGPPDLLASLQRDARWCHGDMQHLLIVSRRGLKTASRVHLMLGVMGYASAPLWLGFMVLTLLNSSQAGIGNWHDQTGWAFLLFGYVLFWLFLPKLLGLFYALSVHRRYPVFGSRLQILGSIVGETIFSMLSAPILMLAHTKFVMGALTGLRMRWGRQNRGEIRPSWSDAWVALGGQTFLGIAVGVIVMGWRPAFLLWLIPVLLSWWLAVPLVRFTSSIQAGDLARRAGLFLIQEETQPTPELCRLQAPMEFPESPFFQRSPYHLHYGLLQAVLDPYINAIHVSLLRWRDMPGDGDRSHLEWLRKRLLMEGPAALRPEERNMLLWDPDSMVALHQELWIGLTEELADWWRLALRHYNDTAAAITRRESELM